jgi:hypothetical protein
MVVALAVALGGCGAADPVHVGARAPSAPAATSCFARFGDNSFSVCIGRDGVFREIGGAAVKVEGYCLQEDWDFDPPPPASFDAGAFGESGFGPSQVFQPNGPNTLPFVITRRSTGVFGLELKQHFSFNAARREATVRMTVRNFTETSTQVALTRYWGGGALRYARTAKSVVGWSEGGSGAALSGFDAFSPSPQFLPISSVEPYASWSSANGASRKCRPAATSTTPTAPSDQVGIVSSFRALSGLDVIEMTVSYKGL